MHLVVFLVGQVGLLLGVSLGKVGCFLGLGKLATQVASLVVVLGVLWTPRERRDEGGYLRSWPRDCFLVGLGCVAAPAATQGGPPEPSRRRQP